ncbi:uncharacterized protein MONOS_18664 [Monocercomonoides exilis]|uniref:uncharacterized protein n=1 Tax=Monocercomonoides exilis TaxID=2049356 RepID=UPI00355A53DE|nr:hypothetical protein MONOS_18664 [Monocercomonoides exilis]
MQKTLMKNEDFWTRVLLYSTSKRQIFREKLSQLEQFTEAEQKRAVVEMNEIMEEMRREDIESVFTKELFDKIDEMIEEEKLSMGNSLLLLKHVGYSKVLKNICDRCFEHSTLSKRLEKIIKDENEKKDEKNERLLTDLCECYLLLHNEFEFPPKTTTKFCVPYLLKVASNKDESEKKQKEVEMSLFALSCIEGYCEVPKELYQNVISEIFQYHQEHHNLTRVAYQSAWEFLVCRLLNGELIKGVIVNELHFGREATRELEELSKFVDWKMKEEENEKRRKKTKEELDLMRWLEALKQYLFKCKLWNEEFIGLLSNIVQVYRTADDKFREICCWCIFPLREAAGNRVVKVEDLLNGGAIDAVLEEIRRQTLNKNIEYFCLNFFLSVSVRLNKKVDSEADKPERIITKRKVLEKLEEEGFEDTFTSFHAIIDFLNEKYYFDKLSLNFSDYSVNV